MKVKTPPNAPIGRDAEALMHRLPMGRCIKSRHDLAWAWHQPMSRGCSR